MLSKLAFILRGLKEFIYPEFCHHCNVLLPSGARHFCLNCESRIPYLDLPYVPENEMKDRLTFLLPVEQAAALFAYTSPSVVQSIIKLLKYKNHPELGVSFGKLLGRNLKRSTTFGDFDVIIPVPLHPRRKKKRGYNQSEKIAEGISAYFPVPILTKAVIRKRNTISQTTKGRFERAINVQELFELIDELSIKDKTVLLVDDVFTTGATIEAFGQTVLKAKPKGIKIATLALAR